MSYCLTPHCLIGSIYSQPSMLYFCPCYTSWLTPLSASSLQLLQVIKIINRILDMLEAEGRLYKSSTSPENHVKEAGQVKLTRRQHILKEMIETERDYVLHMENLQALRKELEQCGAISGDTIHQIFLNLPHLLDFAQKFLIGMEQHYARSEEKQNWGELFLSHREGFQDYEPFIANQTTCDALCTKEWNKIVAAPKSADLQQMVAQLSTLNGFFVKPFQRLTKYPLMLKVGDSSDLILCHFRRAIQQ